MKPTSPAEPAPSVQAALLPLITAALPLWEGWFQGCDVWHIADRRLISGHHADLGGGSAVLSGSVAAGLALLESPAPDPLALRRIEAECLCGVRMLGEEISNTPFAELLRTGLPGAAVAALLEARADRPSPFRDRYGAPISVSALLSEAHLGPLSADPLFADLMPALRAALD